MKTNRTRTTTHHKLWIFAAWVLLLCTACAPLPLSAVNGELPVARAASLAGEATAKDSPAGAILLLSRQPDSEDMQITAIDPTTGELTETAAPLEIGREVNYAFSPARDALAVASRSNQDSAFYLRTFQLDDLQQTAQVELRIPNRTGNWVQQLVYDPQGQHIAAMAIQQGQGHIMLVNLAQSAPQLVKEATLDVYPRLAAYTADGQQIMLIGSVSPEEFSTPPGNNLQIKALVLDAQTLEVAWRQDLEGIKDGFYGESDPAKYQEGAYYQAGIVMDPDNERIHIAHADSEQLTTVDINARTVVTRTVRERQSAFQRWIEFLLAVGTRPVQAKAGNMFYRSAVLSPDRQTLYVVGQQVNLVKDENGDSVSNTVFYGLDAWDVRDGAKRLHVDTEAYAIHQTLDGRLLLNGYDHSTPFTDVFAPSVGKIIARLENAFAYATLDTTGQTVLVASDVTGHSNTRLSIFRDNATLAHVWEQAFGYPIWLEWK